MRDVNSIINPLTLFALLEAVTARPLPVHSGAPKPSRFDEYVTDPPYVLASSGFLKKTSNNDQDIDVALNRPPAELAPANGLRYHDVVYDLSSETVNYYDGSEDSTYYPSAYQAAVHESSGPAQTLLGTGKQVSSVPSEVVKRSFEPSHRRRPITEAPRKAPFSVGYTREEDDWLLLSTSHHGPHRQEVSSAHRVPPFTAAVLR